MSNSPKECDVRESFVDLSNADAAESSADPNERAFVAVVGIADVQSNSEVDVDVLPLDAVDRASAATEADELVRENLATRSGGLNPDGSIPTATELADQRGFTYAVSVWSAQKLRRRLER